MPKSRFARASIGVVIVCGVVPAQSTTCVSLDSAGAQANSHSYSSPGSMSADGRFVAFHSLASNLVAGDSNGVRDIFLRDRQAGTTVRVSLAASMTQGNGESWSPSISTDGRFVAFMSDASNLVTGDTNQKRDVFVRDRTAGTTERVSVTTSGAQSDSDSVYPSISADGRFVAFHSLASNLVPNDTNGSWDIFVRDRTLGMTERVSVDSAGAQGNSESQLCSISGDGRFVAFGSLASNLIAVDTNGTWDIFVRDRQSGTTERVSVKTSGVQGNANSYVPAISGDGRFVAFDSFASNLVAGDSNSSADIFVRDRTSGTTQLVSVATSGVQGNGESYVSSISGDGRFVTFGSSASNLVLADTNGVYDAFVRDCVTSTTERLSVATGGVEANARSFYSAISADGRFAAFGSDASNIVAGDSNSSGDVFVRDRGSLLPVNYCSSGTTTNACSASVTANLNPSLALASACNIAVTNVEGQKSGILFYGINNTGFTPGPWGSGSTSVLCVKHPTQRTPIQNSGGTFGACDGSFALDWNAYQSTHPLALGNPWSIGDKVYVQAWFRDPLAVKTSNLSNALEMTYVP